MNLENLNGEPFNKIGKERRQPREKQEPSVILSASMEAKLRSTEEFLKRLKDEGSQIENEPPLETLDRLNQIQVVLSAIYLAKVFLYKDSPADPDLIQTRIKIIRSAVADVIFGSQIAGDHQHSSDIASVSNELISESVTRRIHFFQRCFDLADQFQLNEESVIKLMDTVQHQQKAVLEDIPKEIPDVLKTFNENQRSTIMDNMFAVELTKGCSLGCPFCGFSAVKQVRASMPVEQAYWLVLNGKGEKFYYYASDPLDYENYVDIVTVHEARYGHTPGTSTAYPTRGAQQLTALGDRVSRVSISQMNIRRLIKDGFYTQLDDDIILPATDDLIDDLFQSSLSILPKIATQVRTIRQQPSTNRQIKPELYYLSEFLGVPNKQILAILDKRSVQLKNTGRERLRNQSGPSDLGTTIACRNGILINNDGVHNSVLLFSSGEYPNGLLNIPVNSESLSNGHDRLCDFQSMIESNSSIKIGRILPHVIVYLAVAKRDNIALSRDMNDVSEAVDHYDNNSGALSKQQGSIFYETIILIAWDANNQQHHWDCQYDLRDGTVIKLKPHEWF